VHLGLALVAVALSGCGGSDRDPGSEVRAAVADFMDALVDSDYEAACELLTPDGQQRVVSAFRAIDQIKGNDCEAILASAFKLPTADGALSEVPDLADQIRSGDVEGGSVEVSVSENTAIVTLTAGQAGSELPLERIDDTWRIDDATNLFIGTASTPT
jgi:hypothetical protein